MGLSIEVGSLSSLIENDEEGYESFKQDLSNVNTCLAEAGLPLHTEPEDCETWGCDMFGYSGLHYLRRLAVHLDATEKLPETPGDENSADDPLLESYYESLPTSGFNHLLQHSDAEGFYLPIDFTEVLFPDEELEIPGGMVGSSIRLLAECQRIAQALGIPAELDESSDELWEAADAQGESDILWRRFGIESYTCVCLMCACKKSIETGAAVVFC